MLCTGMIVLLIIWWGLVYSDEAKKRKIVQHTPPKVIEIIRLNQLVSLSVKKLVIA
jgi:hypothetical protein